MCVKTALLIATMLTACTQAANVSFTISKKKSYVGVPVQLQISIENAEDHTPPSFPDIPNADVRTAPPSSSHMTTIVNGQMERKSTTTYTSQPQTITVKKSDNNDLLSVELTGQKNSVYIGESINVTLEIRLKQFNKNRVKLDFRDMWSTINQNASTWGQFASLVNTRNNNIKVRTTRRNTNGQQHTYFVYSVENQFWPERPGKLEGGNITIVANYPLSVSRNRFSILRRLSIDRAKPVSATVKDPDITVKSPPTQNQPAIFRSAVGNYTIATTATPTVANVGDPITITLSITGNGRLDLLQPPPLTDQPSLTNDFRVPDEPLAGVVNGQTKTFTQSIRATRDDITEIPPIKFAYFDPDIEQYVTIQSDPIPISIKQQTQLPVTQMVEGSLTPSITNLTARTDGLLANIDDPGLLLTTQTVTITPTTLTILGSLPILYTATLLFQSNRRKLKNNIALARRKSAKRIANHKLANAINTTDPTAAANLAASTLTTYIADRCNLPAAGLTRTDAVTHLQNRFVTESLITDIDQLLEECEHIQYAPSTSAAQNITTRTQQCITRLEKEYLK